MKRTKKETIFIFFNGYSENKDAQMYHLIKRLIWSFCLLIVCTSIFTAIKSIFLLDFANIYYGMMGALLFVAPVFLIKLD